MKCANDSTESCLPNTHHPLIPCLLWWWRWFVNTNIMIITTTTTITMTVIPFRIKQKGSWWQGISQGHWLFEVLGKGLEWSSTPVSQVMPDPTRMSINTVHFHLVAHSFSQIVRKFYLHAKDIWSCLQIYFLPPLHSFLPQEELMSISYINTSSSLPSCL